MEIRTIDAGEIGAWRHTMSKVFAFDPAADPHGDERLLALLDLSRAFACVDRGEIVATAAAFDFRLSLPGGSVPMSGLTMVTVMPTHRRRGILRGLIAHHLEAAKHHGDPLSGLWASEATIYGRFGYGIATESESLTLNGVEVQARGRALDEATWVSGDAVHEVCSVYQAASAERPGMFSRDASWWKFRRFSERPDQRGAASPRAYVVFRRGEVLTGYLAFRQRLSFEQGVAAGSVEIDELVTLDAQAELSAWHYVTQVDLFPKVTWWNAPVDSAVTWLATDRRRVSRLRRDTMWLRVDDVARVLAARSYGLEGTLRIGVDGETFALEVAAREGVGGSARCVRVDGEAEVAMDRAALGSILLGGFAPSMLARVGRVQGTATAVARADQMFASAVAPWCPEVF